MPIKILLADKSITIQKVVEMLFSGKDYEVVCVSDGETAINEASRIVPDIVLADIDLPRLDGYTFSARMKQVPALASKPVILMMSRDDVFDESKAKQVSIVDHIAKPFESQELISKVKRAVGVPVQSAAQPAAAPRPSAPAAAKPAPSTPRAATPAPAPKPASSDIFDIIEQAPAHADLKKPAAAPAAEEAVYEVEPVIEVEEPEVRDAALPVGKKAVEEMREGLGLAGKLSPKPDEDIVSFESLNMDIKSAPPRREKSEPVAREWKPPAAAAGPSREEPVGREWKPPVAQPSVSPGDIWNMAEAAVSKIAKEMLEKMTAARPNGLTEQDVRSIAEQTFSSMAKGAVVSGATPEIPEEALRAAVEQSAARIVREAAREVVEKVAWEIIPDLAEMLIKAEIERIKQET